MPGPYAGHDAPTRFWKLHSVIERTLSWLARCLRLTVRNGRRAVMHQGFLTQGCRFICCNALQERD